MLDDRLAGVVADIYAGAGDAARWDRAMLGVAHVLNAHWTIVGSFDPAGRRPARESWYLLGGSRAADAAREYADGLYRDDPTNAFAARGKAGGFDSRSIAADPLAYAAHPYVRWNEDRLGSRYWRFQFGTRAGVMLGMAVHRVATAGPLVDGDARRMAWLFDHMQTAIELAVRPLLPFDPEPLLLLAPDGTVGPTNDAARRLLAAGDGLSMVDGRLRAASRNAGPALARKIAAALAEDGISASLPIPREGAAPLLLTVSPLPDSGCRPGLAAMGALVRIVAPDASPGTRGADWRALFGFTPAEARLARQLLDGEGSLRAAADRLGVAYGTARVQLASLFDKAEVRSQAQLMRLLTRL